MAELEFNADKHEYSIAGRRLPSVTQVLSMIDDRHYDPFYLHRGSMVHLACQYYDEGCLDEESLDPAIAPYLTSYKTFLIETGFQWWKLEMPKHHPRYFYAGTIDRIGDFQGRPAIIDLKSGQPVRTDELQISAYWELIREEIDIFYCFDLYLREDGGMPKLVEVKKPRLLLPVFLSCLTLYQWKENHK